MITVVQKLNLKDDDFTEEKLLRTNLIRSLLFSIRSVDENRF
jgi:hypothetical protein